MMEQRRRPRRAPSLLAVIPLRRLPTKPPKLGDDPTHDCCSSVRLSEALQWEILELVFLSTLFKITYYGISWTDWLKNGIGTNRIEGSAAAGQARASPRVKYPKLAIRTRKKRRNLILSSVGIWLAEVSVCLLLLSCRLFCGGTVVQDNCLSSLVYTGDKPNECNQCNYAGRWGSQASADSWNCLCDKQLGSFTLHVSIFFLLGFGWDGH